MSTGSPSVSALPPSQFFGKDAAALRSGPTSIEDEFAELSKRFPSFAGVYLDSLGRPVVLYREQLEKSETQYAVGRVSQRSGVFSSLTPSSSRQVEFTFEELVSARDVVRALVGQVGIGHGLGIDIERNRLVVRVSPGDERSMRHLLDQRAIRERVVVEAMEQAEPAQSLRSTVRPVTGGLQISSQYNGSSNWCSAGLQMWRTDENGYIDPSLGRYVATAGHCAPPLGSVAGVEFGQPHRGMGLHLVEVANSALHSAGCPGGLNPCQFGDIAVLRVADSVTSTWQRAALSNTANPPAYQGTVSLNTGIWSAVQGQPVRRVGATSGQRNGTITKTCYDLYVVGVWYHCSVEVNGHGDGGDSGGPVYTPSITQYPGSPGPSGIFFAYASATKNPYWFTSISYALFSVGSGWSF